jgi:hypothetical protein
MIGLFSEWCPPGFAHESCDRFGTRPLARSTRGESSLVARRSRDRALPAEWLRYETVLPLARAVGASRGGRDDGRSSRAAARLEPARWPPPRTSGSFAAGVPSGLAPDHLLNDWHRFWRWPARCFDPCHAVQPTALAARQGSFVSGWHV